MRELSIKMENAHHANSIEYIPVEECYQHLKFINNVRFTDREIDILACVVSGRTSKKIASLLDLSPKTIENIIYVILAKLNANSRQSIVDFLEKSEKLSWIRKHYVNLVIHFYFTLELKKIFATNKDNKINCLLLTDKSKTLISQFILTLNKDLQLVGINTAVADYEKNNINDVIAKKTTELVIDYIICPIHKESIGQFKLDSIKNLVVSSKKTNMIFLLLDTQARMLIAEDSINAVAVDFSKQDNYYFFVFALLKRILITENITTNLATFSQQYHNLITQAEQTKTEKINEPKIKSKKKCQLYLIALLLSFCVITMASNSELFNRSLNNQTTTQQDKLILFNLPPRNKNFIGRTQILTKIEKQFHDNKFGLNTQVISGIGGVGKTQLAAEFAYQAAATKKYSTILWVHAQDNNSINKFFIELARFLQINVNGQSTNKIQTAVCNKLSKNFLDGKLLFILDNAGDYNNVQNLIIKLHKKLGLNLKTLNILITSRNQGWPNNPIILESFSPTEALLFCKEYLTTEQNSEIVRLTNTLHYFPLALAQATSFIKSHTNIDEYLALYRKKQQKYLNQFAGDKCLYKESLWKTWQIALTKLSEPAKDIISIASYFYPDDVPINLFTNYSIEERSNAIEELRRHSFIILTNNNKSFKIHRLTQEVIRLTVDNNSIQHHSNANITPLQKALHLLKNKFDFHYKKHANWESCAKYLIHAQDLAEHAIAAGDNFIHSGLQLYLQIAMYFTMVQPDTTHAKTVWLKTMEIGKKHSQQDKSFAIAEACFNSALGYAHQQMGDTINAKKHMKQALSVYQNTPATITTSINQLITYGKWGKNLSALVEGKFDNIATLLIQAILQQDKANFHEANKNYAAGLALLEKLQANPVTLLYKAQYLQCFGSLLRQMGELAKAEDLLKFAQVILDNNFKNHPDRAHLYERLANLYYYIGKHKDAINYINKGLSITRSICTDEQHRIANAKSIAGVSLCAKGEFEQGLTYLKQAEKIHAGHLIKNNGKRAILYLYMYHALEKKKDYPEALKYLIKAKKIATNYWDNKTPIILKHQLSPAEPFPTIDNSEINLQYFEQTLKLIKLLFGEKHILVARHRFILGQIAQNMDNKNQAKQQYKLALNIMNKQQYKDKILIESNQQNIALINKFLTPLLKTKK